MRPPAGTARGVRRLSWGLADQAAGSLTTLCLSIGALRGGAAGATEFAVVFLVHSLAVGFSRSITTEPVAPDLPGFVPERLRRHVRVSGVTGLGVGLLSAAVSTAIVRPVTAVGLWSLAFTLVVVPTDSVRAAWIGARRASRAAPLSVAQFAAAATGLGLAIGTGNAAWSVGTVVATSAALTVFSLARGPRLRAGDLRPAHWVYAAEWSFTSGLTQSSGLVVALLGLPLLPLVLRAQGVVFGPLSTLAQAVAALAVPEFAALRRRRSRLRGAAAALSGLLLALSAAYAAVALLLPDRLFAAVLGSTWPTYQPVLLASAVAAVVGGAAMGPLVALRAHGAARASLAARVVLGVTGLVLPVLAALLGGLAGFFWATAVAALLGGGWALLSVRRVESAVVVPVPAEVPA